MPSLTRWGLLLVGLVVLAACGAPAPNSQASPLNSPFSPVSTPVPQPSLNPPFRLDPIMAGATEVTGQAPVGFTLVVVDVTYGGKQLGATQPDGHGRFRIQVGQPFEPGHLIGLTVDLPPDQMNDEVLNRQLFEASGKGYRIVPNVVTVFDSYEVK
jgi:hypothetical protein